MGKKRGRKGQQSEGQSPKTETSAQSPPSTPQAPTPGPSQPEPTPQRTAWGKEQGPQASTSGPSSQPEPTAWAKGQRPQVQIPGPSYQPQTTAGGRGQRPQAPRQEQGKPQAWGRDQHPRDQPFAEGRGRGAPPREQTGGHGRGGHRGGRGGPRQPQSGDSRLRHEFGSGDSCGGAGRPQELSSQTGSGDTRRFQRRVEVAPPTPQFEQPPSLEPLTITESASDIKPGTLGRRITIETNHVRLNLGTLTSAYRYDVSIEPQKKPKRMLREAMEVFRKAYYPNNHPSYDGQKLLYSANPLPLQDDTISGAVTIETDRGNQEFQITVKRTGTLDLTPLHNLLQKKNMSQDEVFQCVEVVFRQAYVNSFINVGRRFYTPSDNDLGCGAVMYLGGFQAAVQGSVPFMNVDVAHKAFTKSISLVDLIVEMFTTRNRPLSARDIQDQKFYLSGWQLEQMNDYLRGLKVVYEIPKVPGSKKLYRVNELARSSRQEKFQHENRSVTVEEYFQTKWHHKLQNPHLPTVWVGSKDKRICLPIELCVLKEGQPLEGNRVLGTQTSKMIGYSATTTDERKTKIQNVMRTAGHNQNPYIREFGFSIGSEFERLPARVLDSPMLEYIDGQVQPKNGTWWAKRFKSGARIDKWTILGFGVQQERFKDKINDLAKQILQFGRSSGMTFSDPQGPFEYIRNDQRSLLAYLEKKSSYDLIVVVFTPNKDSYYIVKQIAEQRIGLLTQCVKTDTLWKLNETTIRNILLKINCKMNGTNHVLHNLGLISKEPCMVMGADVTHPGPQARTIPSVVAVTASHNRTATAYNISVSIQEPRTEIIQGLERIMAEKLKRFGEVPKRIYFFRDGVSDGEFEKVRNSEVAAIKRACERFNKGPQPKLTFIVVQKRHHTRFFPTDKNSCAEKDKYYNVPVGTCVDTVITDPTAQNFYLLSHQSIKGVGRPTKYQVLYDENGLSNDDLEILAYYLCHLYPRCNRAVSYPAPTYLAHLAADRAKGYLYSKTVDLQNLDQKLVKIEGRFAEKNPMFFS